MQGDRAEGSVEVKQPRRDALPEFFVYRDTGCSIHSSCFTCPLPKCRYEVHKGKDQHQRIERHTEIQRLLASGLSINEVASRTGVGRRTVFRAKAAGAAEGVTK